MKFTIIGGSGFIGTALYKKLVARPDNVVRILDKKFGGEFGSATTIADVRDLNSLRDAILCDSVIINLAAEHRDDVLPLSLYYDVNVAGAKNVCTVASELKCAVIVFTSSVAVYGFAQPGTPESGRIEPFNDYGRSKYQAELVYREWQEESPSTRSLVIVRPTVVFGEGNRGNVFNLMRAISTGRFLMIGSGLNRKSVAYVENVATFIEHVSGSAPGVSVFNYVDKPDFTMNEFVALLSRLLAVNSFSARRVPLFAAIFVGWVADIIARVFGARLPISAVRVRKFCAESTYSMSYPIEDVPGLVTLQDALKTTIRAEFEKK